MTLSFLLIVLLIVAVVAASPHWGYSANWGWGPSGLIGLVLVILILMVMFDGRH